MYVFGRKDNLGSFKIDVHDIIPPPYGRTSRVWDSLLVWKSGCAGGRGFAPRPGQ